ncbi:MAG TPA: hypothetical protein VKA15_25285 [Isosphaeraceae bacterium]|nr:hypothetical protein [Isosphaeraceae bacterium]
MRARRRTTDRDVLCDCWGRWTEILALFALSRPARRRLDPRAYESLRSGVIAACRSLAATDGRERPFYAGLEETVKPWLNLNVLERTDREILGGLLTRCREMERQLNGRKRNPATPRHWRPLAAIAGLCAVIGGLVGLNLTAGVSALDILRNLGNYIWYAINYADGVQLASACVVAVMASIFVVWRSTTV